MAGAVGSIDLSSITAPLKSLADLVTAGFGRMADIGAQLHTDLGGMLDLGKLGNALADQGVQLGNAISLKIDQFSNIESSLMPQLASVRDAVISGAQAIIADRQGTPTPLIKIFLDGRELAMSYGVYLSESDTVTPAAA